MNPNDPPEFANLIKTIKKELPFFSKKTVSMKADHGQLPKNVRNHTIKLNEKFLDNNLHTIDEIKHRNKNNNFVKRFDNYQSRFFNIAPVSCTDTASMLINSYMFAAAACTGISEVNSATSGTGDQAENDQIIFNQMTSDVTVDNCFNQAAVKRGTGTGGNLRIGVYDESSSAPNDLLVQTASLSMPGASSYTFQSLDETEATTVRLWLAFMQTSTTPKILRQQTSGGSLYFRNSYTYGSLPASAGASSSGNPFVTKIGHSG